MSEWVVESDWSKVAVGDRVRVTNLDGADLEFVVKMCADPDYCGDRWVRSSNTRYVCVDWTLYVASKPTPALPTEPGIYVCIGGSEWEQVPLFLYPDGRWMFAAGGDAAETAEGWHARVGLVRLESQADTARKVLERVRHLTASTFQTVGEDIAQVAAEFGVSL